MLRAEYPIAVERFEMAFKQAREYGILRKKYFGRALNFDVELD